MCSLVEIYLNSNNLYALSDASMSPFGCMKNLQSLDMTSNVIQTLSANVFEGLGQLEILFLSNNMLSQLDENLFRNLTNLLWLDLSANRLVNFSKSENLFNNGLTSLVVLYLNENRLEHLDENVFRTLENLQILTLDSNRLTRLMPNVFQGLKKLTKLTMNKNSLSFDDVNEK
jgi:Leucine-rich repeat (LRR) protein